MGGRGKERERGRAAERGRGEAGGGYQGSAQTLHGSAAMVAGSYVIRAVHARVGMLLQHGSSWERGTAGSRSPEEGSKHHRLVTKWWAAKESGR